MAPALEVYGILEEARRRSSFPYFNQTQPRDYVTEITPFIWFPQPGCIGDHYPPTSDCWAALDHEEQAIVAETPCSVACLIYTLQQPLEIAGRNEGFVDPDKICSMLHECNSYLLAIPLDSSDEVLNLFERLLRKLILYVRTLAPRDITLSTRLRAVIINHFESRQSLVGLLKPYFESASPFSFGTGLFYIMPRDIRLAVLLRCVTLAPSRTLFKLALKRYLSTVNGWDLERVPRDMMNIDAIICGKAVKRLSRRSLLCQTLSIDLLRLMKGFLYDERHLY